MAPKQGLTRSEANKEIRRILVKNGIDTSKLQYSSCGRTLTMSGVLIKDGGHEVSATQVENIIKDVIKLGMTIYSELENWTISEGSVSKKGGPANNPNGQPGKQGQSNQQNKGNVQAQTSAKSAA